MEVTDSDADDGVHRLIRSADEEDEESRCCYERYRILVQNECAGGQSVCLCVCLVVCLWFCVHCLKKRHRCSTL